MPYELSDFSLGGMTRCTSILRRFGVGAASMEEVARRVVGFLYQSLTQPESTEPACALVRFFKTHRYGDLPPSLQGCARDLWGGEPPAETQCLTLLATAGIRPEWNSRFESKGHRAIPLMNEDMVAQAPMISNLIQQLGMDLSLVLRPSPGLLLDADQKTFNVFYVPEALGSPMIPAQEAFVRPCGIRSVLGVGGLLSEGSLYAAILFSKVPIPKQTVELFPPLALAIKVAILPFEFEVFSEESAP